MANENDDQKKLDPIGDLVKSDSIEKPINIKEYFGFLNLTDDYSDLQLAPKMLERVRNHLRSLRTGTHATVPLICGGPEKCPIINRCPFAVWKADTELDRKASVFPILRPCPIEANVLAFKVQEYIKEHGFDPDSPSTISLVTKLAELDIYEMRVNIQLATGDRHGQGADLLREEVATIDPSSGQTYKTLKIHPLWDIKESITKQRLMILDLLIATPKAKVKLKIDNGADKDDMVNSFSQFKSTFNKVIDADFVSSEDE